MSENAVRNLSASIPQWTFGDRLRKIRTTHGFTQGDFAEAIGVTKSAIGQWETDRTRPRELRAVALRIELVTGVPASWTLALQADDLVPGGPDGAKRQPKDYKVGTRVRRLRVVSTDGPDLPTAA